MLNNKTPMGKIGANGTSSWINRLIIPFTPKTVNIFQYVRNLENSLVNWMVLAIMQTIILLFLTIGRG